MWKKIYQTNSAGETRKLGGMLARKISRGIIALEGNLGSGKTTFIQGFAKGLGIKEKITSPTFVILKNFKNFYHIDCYRIQTPEEILSIGFKEIISNPNNIVAIEWPEKIKKILPKNIIKIKFKFIDKNTRKIIIS